MKRAQGLLLHFSKEFWPENIGPEKYYLIDRDKSVLSNLYGRIVAEYPEFIVTSVSTSQHYLEKLTQAVDFTRGKKAPLRPGATPKGKKITIFINFNIANDFALL